MNSSTYIVVKEWIFSGETVSVVQPSKNILKWSITKQEAFCVSLSNLCKHAVPATCTSPWMTYRLTDSDYVPLVNLIGIHFQIRDDYQNLQDSQYTNNKGFCEDITEGKFSFPIVHAILSRPDDRQLISTNPSVAAQLMQTFWNSILHLWISRVTVSNICVMRRIRLLIPWLFWKN